jgi:hypothetical protein
MNKYRNGFIIVACLISMSAFAADDAAKPAPAAPAISDKDCAAIVDYQPSADVEYKPGVDANGKPVTPADLTPSVVQMPKKLSFDLNINAINQLGALVPAGSQGLATVGKVAVDLAGGEVTWNGKPIEGDAMAALKAACAARKAPDSSRNPPK